MSLPLVDPVVSSQPRECCLQKSIRGAAYERAGRRLHRAATTIILNDHDARDPSDRLRQRLRAVERMGRNVSRGHEPHRSARAGSWISRTSCGR